MAILFSPYFRAADQANEPIPGAFLTFYKTGTSTLQPIWSEFTLSIALANPIQADGNGVFPAIWLDDSLPAYKIVLQYPDPNNSTVPGSIVAGPNGTLDPYNSLLSVNSLLPQLRPHTPSEIASGFPINDLYDYPDVRRFGAKCDGVTDDTTAINNAATVARNSYPNGGGVNYIEFRGNGPSIVSATLDFSGIDVYGYGEIRHIQATSAQFDVITSTGSTKLINLRVHGGWDGVTAGQTGSIVTFSATSPAHPYQNNIHNCTFTFAKQRIVFINHGGYTSFTGTNVFLSAGLHIVECFGTAPDQCTTVTSNGTQQWGGAPNGFAIKLTECTKMTFLDVISENTQGYQLNGGDNRAIAFLGCYQENTAGGIFITDNGSGGIGLLVESCFGGNTILPFFSNWVEVVFIGNSNMATGATPYANRIFTHSAGAGSVSVTGDVTIGQLTLAAGTYDLRGTVQTIISTGGGTATQLACQITTNSAASGLASSTSSLVEGASQTQSFGSSQDARVNCSIVIQVLPSTFTASIATTVMTVTGAVTGSPLYVGQTIYGPGIVTGTVISSLGSGTGGAGTYNLNNSQTLSSTTLTGAGSQTYYLRAHIVLIGTITEAYNGILRAMLLNN